MRRNTNTNIYVILHEVQCQGRNPNIFISEAETKQLHNSILTRLFPRLLRKRQNQHVSKKINKIKMLRTGSPGGPGGPGLPCGPGGPFQIKKQTHVRI